LSLLALGVSLIGFKLIKTNKFYPVALTIFLYGVIVNYGIGFILSRYLNGYHLDDISHVSTMAISGILSMIFVIAGVIRGNRISELH
jgi:F0F1-type ATP synthase membrane subunit a